MRLNALLFLVMLASFVITAHAQVVPAEISARSPEVLATYKQSDEFLAGLKSLKPKLESMCANLLSSQLRLQQESNSWKLYSLYEMLEKQALMTSQLQRVATVTELSGVLPKYTNYRLIKDSVTSFEDLKSGSLIIADKGPQCGPDPLSVTKGAYFLKCGAYLIGSGIIKADKLSMKSCLNIRILQNKSIY